MATPSRREFPLHSTVTFQHEGAELTGEIMTNAFGRLTIECGKRHGLVKLTSDQLRERMSSLVPVIQEPDEIIVQPTRPAEAPSYKAAPAPELPGRYQDETLAAREAGQKAASFVISDEWYGQIEEGNPFHEVAKPYMDANPNRYFRFIGERHSKARGTRGFQPTRDGDGKAVMCNGMQLASIPMEVGKERRRRIQANAADQARIAGQKLAEQANKAAVDSKGAVQLIMPSEAAGITGVRPQPHAQVTPEASRYSK
jgi:hypothetical protein